jgi:PAS domain-containing protein
MTQRYAGTRSEREGLWDWNLVTNRIHVSPRWLALIGCDEHEIGHTPESWLNRIHPEDRDRVNSELESARNDGRFELDVPHRLRHKNGTYRWMSCRALIERDQHGLAVRLTGWHADVTAEEVTDPVTGLPNHKLLIDRLTLAIERTKHADRATSSRCCSKV